MCGIVAALAVNHPIDLALAMIANGERGRDSWGYWTPSSELQEQGVFPFWTHIPVWPGEVALGSLRAEPTTEWVRDKSAWDFQPYQCGEWVIVHNGTIANDKELRRPPAPTAIDSWVIAALLDSFSFGSDEDCFADAIGKLVGSYAIAAVNVQDLSTIHFAMNYKPLYFSGGNMLSSVQLKEQDVLLPPYSIGTLSKKGIQYRSLRPVLPRDKALVICSGGLDSTVAAASLIEGGVDVELLHFDYGCRATASELIAVRNISAALDVPLHILPTPIFTDVIKGSPLTGTGTIASAVAGAEYAHEWVPARNLIMLSIAAGIAESRGFNILATGANLEEAGAYPDNEPQFLKQFNAMLPFAVRDGAQIQIASPVGNLMKHEIVKLGLALGAPLHLTWSCYNTGATHCGHCGPCYMRKTAFEINGARDPVFDIGREGAVSTPRVGAR